MEDYNDSEPLNLVKKKPKPVAVVAPSAVIEAGDKCKDEADEEEEEIKVEDLSLGRKEEGCLGKVVEDVNKNCFWDKSSMGYQRGSDTHNGVYSMLNNLTSAEPNFLTALYMRSLMPPGGYLGSYSLPPMYPPMPEDPQAFWAHQRFWQMVQLNEAQKTTSQSPKGSSSLTDALSITVPPLGSTKTAAIQPSKASPEDVVSKKLKQKR